MAFPENSGGRGAGRLYGVKEGIKIPDTDWNWEEMYDICRLVTKDLDGDGMLDQFGICNYDWLDAVYSNGGDRKSVV